MIPKMYLAEWMNYVPWQMEKQIEQDLIITTALVRLYNDPVFKSKIAFRGGTALNKLFFNSSARYSEDIDLVQIAAEPIGATMQSIKGSWRRGESNTRFV